MRLINSKTLKLESFQDYGSPRRYAILSHTWENHEVTEVTFADMKAIDNGDERPKSKSGYEKIRGVCDLANGQTPPVEYVWVDSCCIDKSSSHELSECINSMFLYYKTAACCWVYLSDFTLSDNPYSVPFLRKFERCKWFSRGWTLQELIAPETVHFYDKEWKYIGEKSKILLNSLAFITGVNEEVLQQAENLSRVPVATKMSWASNRSTTRVEDAAYCLFGIFGVNMPLLYGEREKAFYRLQQEIARSTHDLSLFAWDNVNNDPWYSIFAKKPSYFRNYSKVRMERGRYSGKDFTLTNKGLHIEVAHPTSEDFQADAYLDLNCVYDDGSGAPLWLAVPLVNFGGVFFRESRELRRHRLHRPWLRQAELGHAYIHSSFNVEKRSVIPAWGPQDDCTIVYFEPSSLGEFRVEAMFPHLLWSFENRWVCKFSNGRCRREEVDLGVLSFTFKSHVSGSPDAYFVLVIKYCTRFDHGEMPSWHAFLFTNARACKAASQSIVEIAHSVHLEKEVIRELRDLLFAGYGSTLGNIDCENAPLVIDIPGTRQRGLILVHQEPSKQDPQTLLGVGKVVISCETISVPD